MTTTTQELLFAQEVEISTDVAGKGTNHKPGKGSSGRRIYNEKRAELFRLRKNKETQESILSGIYARLKISDPTTVAAAPLAEVIPPAVAPVGPVAVRMLPDIDRALDTMQMSFAQMDNAGTEAVFTKDTLILTEAKIS